jgi:alanyl-tRNA synthetase
MAVATGTLRTSPDQLVRRIESLLEEKRRLEKQVEDLLKSGGRGKREEGRVKRIGEVTLSVEESSLTDRGQIGLLLDAFREQHRQAVGVIVAGGERPSVHVAVTDDLVARGVKAGDLVGRIAAVSGGRGGGRPQFASAGVGDPARLGETLAQIEGIVREAVGAAGAAA